MPKKYHYITIALLGIATVVLVVLIYGFTSVEQEYPTARYEDVNFSDLTAVIKEINQSDSWIYKMQLHKKQNVFSYPRTVYHIKLNSGE